MSEFKWTHLTPNVEIWWDKPLLKKIADPYFTLHRSKYHRADGPFVRVAGDGYRNFVYLWWRKGQYFGTSLIKFLEDSKLTDEEKALLILEWL